MGLSYNPSSFATNKTILEAIEELKRYLIANPLACIYQVPGSVTADLRTLYLTSIVIPTGQEIKSGDIVIAMNGYFNFVDSVGTSEVYFADDWCNLSLDVQSITLNFDSTYGEIVNTPANFTGWIYRRFPRTSDRYYRGRRYYLEITYKDSTAFPTTQTATIFIPSNYLNAIWYQLNVDNSTTIYFDFTEDPEQQIYQLTDFTIPAGQNGADGVSITGATIDASNHLILTLSDGNTIDAGALPTPSEYTHTVTISTTSGTFSDSDFALLGYGDSVIIYDDGTIKTAYKLKLETASVYEFECIDATSKNNLKLIDVNKTTKAYSMTSVAMIKSATFDSGTATSGKVLTANGSGGTSWETPSGGIDYVTIDDSNSSGTIALTDVTKLLNNGAVLIGSTYGRNYVKYLNSSSNLSFIFLSSSSDRIQLNYILITKSTGAWSQYQWLFPNEVAQLKSTGASSGQVATADGSGGVSWQNASGYNTYSFSSTAGNNSHRIRLYNILKNSKAVRYLECRTYAIPCIFSSNFGDESSLKISGTNYFSGGVSVYEFVLTSSGSLSGNKTTINTDGTVVQQAISYNDYAFKVSYINDTEITA